MLVVDGVKHEPPERRTCPDGHAPLEVDEWPVPVELPVPVFGPVQPFGPRTCPDGHAPPGRPGLLWPPVVAPEPQTPFT